MGYRAKDAYEAVGKQMGMTAGSVKTLLRRSAKEAVKREKFSV
jgi:hypothetical protein